jgi:hypothetical protein
MAPGRANDLAVFWTHGFIAGLFIMVAIAGFCVMLPPSDSWIDNRSVAGRRRRTAAAAAVAEVAEMVEMVEMDDVHLEREALRVANGELASRA